MDVGNGNGPEIGSGPSTGCAVESGNPTQPTRSSSRLWNKYYLPLQVFNNDLLLEKILGYALLSGGQAEKRESARSLRLVARYWNEMIIKLFYKNGQPLFYTRFIIATDEEQIGRFCAKFASTTLVNDRFSPFHLTTGTSNFTGLKLETQLNSLLTPFGEGLIDLRIWMTQKGNLYKNEFSKWPLITLSKLDIILRLTQRTVNNGDGYGLDDETTVDLQLLKAVFRDATNIADFTIDMLMMCINGPVNSVITGSSFLEPVNFPASITKMTLSGQIRTKDLEALARKRIPNLSSLDFHLDDHHSLVEGLLFRILENFRASLKAFSIQVDHYHRRNINATLIRFPVMEKLEEVSMDSSCVDLEYGLNSLERSLPKIRTLRLHYLTCTALRKWTASSKFISVTTLQFRFAETNHLDDPCGLTMETMQSVNFAFPNVRKLELSFSGRDASGLEYLFKEMTQLTDLKLFWDKGTRELDMDVWEAVITGLPIETVARFWDSPDLWERNELKEEQLGGSIKNLKELASLSLSDYRPSMNAFNNFGSSETLYISDLAFRFALLQMPKLRKLCLLNGFKASAKMTKEWRNAGRVLEYSK